jgi:hypothetical protein
MLRAAGRNDLLRGLASACVREIAEYHDEYGSIEFQHKKAGSRPHVSADAMAPDVDDVPIEAILSLRENELHELEILRLDGGPIQQRPAAERFSVWMYGHPETAEPPLRPDWLDRLH